MDPTADLKEMVASINLAVRECDFDLTDWETEFIESIGAQLKLGRIPSEKQETCLVKIWNRLQDPS